MLESVDLMLVQLIIQKDVCYQTIGELGNLGILQFKDLNPAQNAFQRNFIRQLRMGDEILRKLHFFEQEMIKSEICESAETSLLSYDCIDRQRLPDITEIIKLDGYLEQVEGEVRALLSNETSLQQKHLEFIEMKNALTQSLKLYEEIDSGSLDMLQNLPPASSHPSSDDASYSYDQDRTAEVEDAMPLIAYNNRAPHRRSLASRSHHRTQPGHSSGSSSGSGSGHMSDSDFLGGGDVLGSDMAATQGLRLGFITGVIREDKYNVFEKVLWRGCRGNVYIKNYPISDRLVDPQTGEPTSKRVFVVLSQGSALDQKIQKICNGFGATIFDLQDNTQRRQQTTSTSTSTSTMIIGASGMPSAYQQQNRGPVSNNFLRSKKLMLLNLEREIDDISELLSKTNDYKLQILLRISTEYERMYIKTKKMMATYMVMNKLNYNTSQSALVGEAWCPKDRYDMLQQTLNTISRSLTSGDPQSSNGYYTFGESSASNNALSSSSSSTFSSPSLHSRTSDNGTVLFANDLESFVGHTTQNNLDTTSLIDLSQTTGLPSASSNINTLFSSAVITTTPSTTMNSTNDTLSHPLMRNAYNNAYGLSSSASASSSPTTTSIAATHSTVGFGNIPTILNELQVKNKKQIPTYFRTNKFTDAYQNIISAYGIATYKEVNPTLFTIISFPFLFAVMFGDVGHGILMTLFASVLIYYEKSLARARDEYTTMIFPGRYLIFLMGVFSVYIGLLYNDMFSKPLTLFTSGYTLPQNDFHGTYTLNPTHIVQDSVHCPQGCGYNKGSAYPFGIDHLWALSTNKLTFQNSLKMKASVLLGVIHMLFGTCLSLVNYKKAKDTLSIYAVFVPEVIFMVSLFGYLSFCIILKWLSPFEKVKEINLLLMLINMVLDPMGDIAHPLFPGQKQIQNLLLVCAAICVPWLLLAKPYFLYKRHHDHLKKQKSNDMMPDMEDDPELLLRDHRHQHREEENKGDHHGHFDMSEIFVHQVIHTIEYCLGAVSNTASYLRLWALSLAHAQLSEVLWNMILNPALKSTYASPWVRGSVLAFSFYFWAVVTLGVLLGMEAMSSFLHALRLHWVEFQGKFYKAEGTAFQPFCFSNILNSQDGSTA